MNDQDLERDLRTQAGPREQGYRATRLPLTPEDAATNRPRSPRMPRVLMLAGAGVAGALAVAVLAGALAGHGPGVGSGSPSASASAPTAGRCVAADLDLVAEPWGGAAGGRGTIVTISLGAGRSECLMSGPITAEVADANGVLLVSGTSNAADGSIDLQRGTKLMLSVVWSNWCGTDPMAPVALSIKADGWRAAVPVIPGGDDPVPPCNGAGEPSSLSVSSYESPSYN